MSKKVFLILSFILLTSLQCLYAVPAYPELIKYRQSDGSIIMIRAVGDEFNGRIVSEDGYTLVGGEDSNYYYAVIGENGKLTPSSVMVKSESKMTESERIFLQGLPKGLAENLVNSPLNQMRRNSPSNLTITETRDGDLKAPEGLVTFSDTKGNIKSLVILVEFDDRSFTLDNPVQSFSNMLNQEGYSHNGATGSAKDYYIENSDGQFTPEFDVVGPVKLSHTAVHYAGSSGVDMALDMTLEACNLLVDQIDFSEYADNGKLRDIFIFYAGHNMAEGAPQSIWPHRYSGNGVAITDDLYDGCQLLAYACSSELRGAEGDEMAGIGTFCHEFGHVLGWVDLYDTNSDMDGLSYGLEYLSLMNTGPYLNEGRTPPAIIMMERWMVGWSTPEVLAENGSYVLPDVTQNKGYVIKAAQNGEYFMIDYRDSKANIWEKYIGNSDGSTHEKGFMITHVDAATSRLEEWQANAVNTNIDRELVKLLRSSDGKTVQDQLFPGINNVTNLTADINPNYTFWNGERVAQELFNMETLDREGKFDVVIYKDKGEPRIILTSVINNLYLVEIENAPEDAEIVLYLNGVKLEDNKVLESEKGIHAVTAVITDATGMSRQIFKYFEVK